MKLVAEAPRRAEGEAAGEGPLAGAKAAALILFNEKAGGVTAADRDRLTAIAEAEFSYFEFLDVEEMTDDFFKKARKFDVVVVLGGDGTARAVAENAPKSAPPLILLPGGTLNVLPRALYGDLAWPEALTAALQQGRIKRLSLGRANGDPFFVAAIFGGPTLLARAREAVREGRYYRAWLRFQHAMKRAFTHRIRARPQGGRMRTAKAVGVLCPSYSGAVEGDDLEWVRLDSSSVIDLLRLGLRSFSAAWRDDPAVSLRRCKRGDIVSSSIIPATLDGEPKTFPSRVRITFERNGPCVIALDLEQQG